MNDSKNKVSQAMDARTNPLHGSNGGEMLAPAIRQIPLENIRPDPDQPRRRVATDGPEWEGLLASVREHGVLQPILVQPVPDQRGQYMIVSGERRWQAAKVAQHSHITARIIKSDAMLARKAEIQLIENALRQGLSPLDEMEACVRLLASTGMSKGELAGRLGVSNALVTEILKLDAIAPEVRAAIRSSGKRFSRRQLLGVAGKPTPASQRAALDGILASSADGSSPSGPERVRPIRAARWEDPRELRGDGYRCRLDLADASDDAGLGQRAAEDLEIALTGQVTRQRAVELLRRLTNQLAYELNVKALYRRLGIQAPQAGSSASPSQRHSA